MAAVCSHYLCNDVLGAKVDHKQYVIRLKIPVDDPPVVEVITALSNLRNGSEHD